MALKNCDELTRISPPCAPFAQNKAQYSSYVSEPWFDMYLESRDSLPINVNPQVRHGAFTGTAGRITRNTHLLGDR